ncbi:MAG TPA: LOG family protein, partial [Candidatus Kapabacteria bacterium]|nr:LOG family protein [Candidatus Kapabacteria bacterium]
WSAKLPPESRYYVCTGGGPGMMEAANRGAFQANQPSIGLNISLPFEQEPNIFISDELNFEFHYFFMRKFWFAYLAKAMVALPGGFGTLDELFEILTLRQTLKITRPLPIVLYSEEFWKNTVNFNYLLENRMISEKDFDLFIYANSPKEAFDYLVEQLKASWEFYEKGY